MPPWHSMNIITRSPRVNLKRENGYHRAMINYDELWIALNTKLYEINPHLSAALRRPVSLLRCPKEGYGTSELSNTWHAARYLFDQ